MDDILVIFAERLKYVGTISLQHRPSNVEIATWPTFTKDSERHAMKCSVREKNARGRRSDSNTTHERGECIKTTEVTG